MTETDLEAAIDELYAVDPDEFTARRNELAKTLRGEGRRAAAQQVLELRKPSRAAWAVNQLARRNRREVDLLLDAGHRAREAQQGVIEGGERTDLEQALRNERRALQTLVGAARGLLTARGSEPAPALIEKVSRTLRAAAVTDEGREALARGRLVKELGPAGFEAFSGFAAARPSGARARRTGAAAPPGREAVAAARKRRDDARKRLRTVEKRLEEAETNARTLRAQLRRADDDVEALRSEREAAAADADEADRAFERLRKR